MSERSRLERVEDERDWNYERHNEALTQRDKAIAERERLEAALRQLQHGPDTLTQDGLRIVLDALYPTPIQGGGE